MIIAGSGPAYIAVTPRCPEHGEMKPRQGSVNGYTGTIWACPGWDGEGCGYQAPAAEWKQIGIAGPARIYLDGELTLGAVRRAGLRPHALTADGTHPRISPRHAPGAPH